MRSIFFAAALGAASWATVVHAQAAPPQLEPEAVTALRRMSAYLGTLTAFEIRSDTSLDLVLDDGQKVQIDGVTTYRVRRPNGFVIENVTNRKARRFVYDGRRFTVYAPRLGYYAQVDAPPTIRQTLDAVHDRHGITLPLEDLFRWSEPDQGGEPPLQSAMVVGDAVIDGSDTRHYAFRQGELDWQIWIQKGDKPVPRKLVLVSRDDEARPAYAAHLTWNVAPQLAADAFTFRPGPDAKPIRLGAQDE